MRKQTGFTLIEILIVTVIITVASPARLPQAAARVVLLPAVPEDYVERFESIFTMEERQGRSAETRWEILEHAWQVFLWYPLLSDYPGFDTAHLVIDRDFMKAT